MAMVDDDFISQLLTRFNLIFSFLPIMARILLNEPETNFNILYATMRNPKVCNLYNNKCFVRTFLAPRGREIARWNGLGIKMFRV